MRRSLAAAMLALVASLPPLRAQAPVTVAADSQPFRVDAFLGAGFGGLVGGASKGGADAGLAGIGVERRLGTRTAMRVELFSGATMADLGETGYFALPTKVTLNYAGVSLGVRRYTARNRYGGIGLSIAKVTVCDVDTEGGPGFFGGETEACRGFADIPLRPQDIVSTLHGAAGVRWRRFALGVRADAGLQPFVETDAGTMRHLSLGVVGHYNFGGR